MVEPDWPAVRAIYAAGIATRNATFESEPPEWTEFDADKHQALRFVAEGDGRILGWVAASPVPGLCVDGGVAEHSVYVDPESAGRGIGRALLTHLIEASEVAGIWTLQSGIFLENASSLALHARCGFRVVGTRERLARHNGRWRDVVMVERRAHPCSSCPPQLHQP